MATLLRLRVEWAGAPVTGGGLSTFYFTDGAVGQSADVEGLFYAIRFSFPAGITWTIPDGGDTILDTTGELTGSWGSGGGATVASAGTGDYAAGVGARVVWRTAGVNGGRRVNGSTFLVPLDVVMYGPDGTIDTGGLATLVSAADALVTAQASAFTIWSRSVNGGAGANQEVTSATVVDKGSGLRSRRT